MATRLLRIGVNAGAREAANRVQHRGHQADRPVGEQLGREQPEQGRGDLALGRESRRVAADRVEVDDQRRGEQEEHGCDEQDAGRQGQHGRDRLDGLGLRARRQPAHEHRDEGGREDAAEHEIVNDVRRVVGEVERVGQVRVPEGIDRDENAQKSGDARDEGPDPLHRWSPPRGPGVGWRPRRADPDSRRRTRIVASRGAYPGETRWRRYPRQGARQAPPVDRPMSSRCRTRSVAFASRGRFRNGARCRFMLFVTVMLAGAPPAPSQRGPQPPDEQEGPRSGSQPDRDSRDRRGTDGEFAAYQDEAPGRREKLAAAGSNRRRCALSPGR